VTVEVAGLMMHYSTTVVLGLVWSVCQAKWSVVYSIKYGNQF